MYPAQYFECALEYEIHLVVDVFRERAVRPSPDLAGEVKQIARSNGRCVTELLEAFHAGAKESGMCRNAVSRGVKSGTVTSA